MGKTEAIHFLSLFLLTYDMIWWRVSCC